MSANAIPSCPGNVARHSTTGNRLHRGVGLSRQSLLVLSWALASLLLSACATQNNLPDSAAEASPADRFGMGNPVSAIDRTMANDISGVLTQIFDSVGTTIQVNTDTTDPIRDHLIEKFSQAGYGIQQVSADQGSNFLSYNKQETQVDDKTRIKFAVTIGAIDVSREYFLTGPNSLATASTFRLSGTRAPVSVNEKTSARKQVPNADFSAVTYVASLNLEEQVPVISLITPDLVNQVASIQSSAPSLNALNSSNVEVNNLFYAEASTFSSLLDNRERIARQVVVFGNDSMILGDTNKLIIDQFVNNRVADKDLISLVGCSNGPTALEIGNEGLALGRAQRVTQALVARGIARDRILDEGCWAPVSAGDKFPGRGVVLELWRGES